MKFNESDTKELVNGVEYIVITHRHCDMCYACFSGDIDPNDVCDYVCANGGDTPCEGPMYRLDYPSCGHFEYTCGKHFVEVGGDEAFWSEGYQEDYS